MTEYEIFDALLTRCRIRHRDVLRGTSHIYDYAAAWRISRDDDGEWHSSLELISKSGAVPCVVVVDADECEAVT